MNSEQQALWSTIQAFDIDGGPASLTFTKRLARENGWNAAFAERVVDEYKKFVFLCAAAGHPCSPSDEVDQAWHLHMIYTESYWIRLCGEVLPKPLHHGPTKGGQVEADKFVDWYERTLESYRAFFRQEPPTDIWPSGKDRFANSSAWKRVDTSRFWMAPRAGLRRAAKWVGAGTALLVGGLGCGYLAQTSSSGIVLFLVVGMIFFLVIVAILVSRSNRGGGSSGSGCSSSGGSGCGSSHHSGDSSDGGSDGGSGCGGGCGGGGD